MNCWEFRKCGREPGGFHSEELGVCGAATEVEADGINGGDNGGRVCWAVARTVCSSEDDGSYAAKYLQCKKCDFYNKVMEEQQELGGLVFLPANLLAKQQTT